MDIEVNKLFGLKKSIQITLHDDEFQKIYNTLVSDGWEKSEEEGFFSPITSLTTYTFTKGDDIITVEIDNWFTFLYMPEGVFNNNQELFDSN